MKKSWLVKTFYLPLVLKEVPEVWGGWIILSTGSYHHLFHGIHLRILQVHFRVHIIAHFFSIDSIIYSLQEGICIQ